MWKRCSVILLVTLSLGAYENEIFIENSNFTLSNNEEGQYFYNYNRLRVTDTVTHEGFYGTAIVDLVNYFGREYINSTEFSYIVQSRPDTPFDTHTDFHYHRDGQEVMYGKIHRLYAGYADTKHQVTFGLQNITLGVGHIWTPTDLYNPKNSLALEPDEVFGVMALSYTCTPSSLSSIQTVVSLKEDKSFKYALRYKAFLEFADVGLSFIHSDDITMYGYEIEGDLFDTGAQWRSEGGYYKSRSLDRELYQLIVGFDYAFTWGLNWTLEGYYSSDTFSDMEQLENFNNEMIGNMVQSDFYLGTTLGYDFDLAWSGSLLMIGSFEGKVSSFTAPTLTYTLNDHHCFSIGAMLYTGSKESEFGLRGDSYYLNWKWSF